MSVTRTLVLPDSSAVAEAVAARLVSAVLDALADRGVAHVVLTGGGVGTASLAALARLTAIEAVDWSAVHLWWGDERFLPPGDPDRNETQARAALIDALPIPPAQVHPMPAAGGGEWGDDPDAAATAYAAELSGWADATGPVPVPVFDVLMLGVGPDGHVASLFPGHPALDAAPGVTTVGVRESPKPPPLRVSLTFAALHRAREVWLLAAGAEKADAVARALGGADVGTTPAAGARGTEATLWFLDRASAPG